MAKSFNVGGPETQFGVTTFNINGFLEPHTKPIEYGWKAREAICAEMISHSPSQIIAVQELKEHCVLPILQSFAAKKRDFDIVASKKMKELRNAIFFDYKRFKLREYKTLPLSPTGIIEPAWGGSRRTALFASFCDKLTGRDFWLINCHLDHVSMEARNRGTDLILQRIQTHTNRLPIIFTGDSNVSVNSQNPRWQEPEMRYPYDKLIEFGFQDTWTVCHPGQPRPNMFHDFAGPNYTEDEYGTNDTDQLMVKGFEVLSSDIVTDSFDGKFPSDHYPFEAKLKHLP